MTTPDAGDVLAFGPLLRRHRLVAGLTQEALAERTGLGTRSIQHLEGGTHLPHRDTVARLVGALGLGGTERSRFARAARPTPRRAAPPVPSDQPTGDDTPRPAPRHNLPAPLTPFVGRAAELAEVRRLLGAARLVTVTGAGGSGKTRLAQRVAAELVGAYPDGVWFVGLAPLADPAFVPAAVASALGVVEQPGQPLATTLRQVLRDQCLATTLRQVLRDQCLLLLLDNCEHLVEACAHLTEALLTGCPAVRVLATSREALGIAGEVAWELPPLALPPPDWEPSPEEDPAALGAFEAVALFVGRARAADPSFEVTRANAPAVVQVCRRVDGLPLALELAAARVRVFAVERIAGRLDDLFGLLTGGSRTALPRHPAGPTRLEPRPARRAGAPSVPAPLRLRRGLRLRGDRGRLRRRGRRGRGRPGPADAAGGALARARGAGGTRALPAAGDAAPVRTRAAGRGRRGRRAARPPPRLVPAVRGAGQARAVRSAAGGLARPARDRARQPTGRVGMGGGARAGGAGAAPGRGAVAVLLRARSPGRGAGVAGAGPGGTGRARVDGRPGGGARRGLRAGHPPRRGCGRAAPGRGEPGDPPVLGDRPGAANALRLLALRAVSTGDQARAEALGAEALALARDAGASWVVAQALEALGLAARERGDHPLARGRLEESLALFRDLDDRRAIASSLMHLGWQTCGQGDHAAARAYLQESVTIARELRSEAWVGRALSILGVVARLEGDHARSRALLEEGLALVRKSGDRSATGSTLVWMGSLARAEGDVGRAETFVKEALALFRDLGAAADAAAAVGVCGVLAIQGGSHRRGARLLGAVKPQDLRRPLLFRDDHRADEESRAAARAALGERGFAAATAQGEAMTPEQAIASALEGDGG